MATYKELQNQIFELQRKAEDTRVKELDGAIQEIKALMQEYGLTVADLTVRNSKKSTKSKQQSNIHFKDADGNTWSGRGRVPAWLKGKDKEQFRI